MIEFTTLADVQLTGHPILIWGAVGFGMLIGWYVYYINRYRTGDVQLSDIVTVIGVLGGAGITALFPAGSELFAGYGIGLAIGFFGYFLVLVMLVGMSKNFNADWFLDGRRKKMAPDEEIPGGVTPTARAMGGGGAGDGNGLTG